MNKSPEQIFNEKISLIYEFDKRSPVFVRVANTELDNNNIEKAIEILNTGLKTYPSYPTAYILLGKAYTLLGSYSLAVKHYQKGSDMLNSPRTMEYYRTEIESIRHQRSFLELSRKNSFFAEEKDEDQTELFDADEPESGIDSRLSQLAKKISAAKIDAAAPVKTDENKFLKIDERHVIISETLAKIYEAQGEYKEAIAVYKKLITKNPEKSDEFNLKIDEIQKKLED